MEKIKELVKIFLLYRGDGSTEIWKEYNGVFFIGFKIGQYGFYIRTK